MNAADLRKHMANVQKQVEKAMRLQIKLEAHIAKADKILARLAAGEKSNPDFTTDQSS